MAPRIAFSTGGRLVAAVSPDRAAYVWETHSGRLLEKIPLEAPTLDLAYDTSGDRLFVPSDGRLLALDLTGGANRTCSGSRMPTLKTRHRWVHRIPVRLPVRADCRAQRSDHHRREG